MEECFRNCYHLISLDLSNFNIQNVTDMKDMFIDCQFLKKSKIIANDNKLKTYIYNTNEISGECNII